MLYYVSFEETLSTGVAPARRGAASLISAISVMNSIKKHTNTYHYY